MCFYSLIIPQMAVSVLARDIQGMDLNGRGGRKKLGGAQARQSVNKIHFMKKNFSEEKLLNAEKNYSS